MWSKDKGYFYGSEVFFRYDNATNIPVISVTYAEALHVRVHTIAKALTITKGYSNISYKARHFALITFSLPNQTTAIRAPFLVSDAPDLPFMLIPSALADKDTFDQYLSFLFVEPHTPLRNELLKYQSFCYAISAIADPPSSPSSEAHPPSADARLHRHHQRLSNPTTATNTLVHPQAQDIHNAYHFGPNPMSISARVRMQESANETSPFLPTVHILLPDTNDGRLLSAMCMDFNFDFNSSFGSCPISLRSLAIQQYSQSTDSSGQDLPQVLPLYLLRLHIDEWPTRLQVFPRHYFLPGFSTFFAVLPTQTISLYRGLSPVFHPQFSPQVASTSQ
jgi:hypothetical protein